LWLERRGGGAVDVGFLHVGVGGFEFWDLGFCRGARDRAGWGTPGGLRRDEFGVGERRDYSLYLYGGDG
jgi:hypothetical protein